ncbi:ABC transporter ATP-binding protein [Canibacter oris]|uniref:ABC-2 type transport system ATP-binding protein n=1 Tax=Canibacter oris TaxID=1365628 RepID=A0A840DHK0_9MICO|nr:ABC transporter ATP-binding protein [Canibacter oris]MBB4072210.1 ABC-2 type transport system ATP-binding protein [Canibacter oris]
MHEQNQISPHSIEILNLTKVFGQKVAVNNLSLAVPQGTMFGIVGPNGAGKTTTLSMVTGILEPTQGSVAILGKDVWQDPVAAKAAMGVLPDGIRQFERLTGKELLRYTGMLRGLTTAETEQRATELLQLLGLTEAQNKMIVDYSAGMKKKIGIAAALIHAPKLVILDEPFEAVDPVSSEVIRDILRRIVAGGGTVVLSSHVMELVEKVCDAVAVIHQGTLVAAGTIADVTQGKTLQERFVELVGGHAELDAAELNWLAQNGN